MSLRIHYVSIAYTFEITLYSDFFALQENQGKRVRKKARKKDDSENLE